MHKNATDCIFVTGNEDALALVDSLGDNSLCVKRN
jgi:hypothetical protein